MAASYAGKLRVGKPQVNPYKALPRFGLASKLYGRLNLLSCGQVMAFEAKGRSWAYG